MIQFLIFATIIFVAGPVHNEGVGKLVEEKGVKEAASIVWENRDKDQHKKNENYNQ